MNSGLEYSIIMDSAEVEAVLLRTAQYFPRYINSWLVQAGTMTKAEMEGQVNEGVGAAMGQGIKNNIEATYDAANFTASIGPNDSVSSYALALETGSKPHRPPSGPDSSLAQWCEMKELNTWAIAAIIARDGTKPHPYVEPTYQVVEGPISDLFESGVAVYLDSIGALV